MDAETHKSHLKNKKGKYFNGDQVVGRQGLAQEYCSNIFEGSV
jgi:hypothetical protein